MRRYLLLTVTSILFLFVAVNTFAATYYVKADGNDNVDGRSDSSAWKTIGKVNSYNFATGDDVYFKCGDIWTEEQLAIDWSGNTGNRAIVAAYYMNGGIETIGVSGNKPVVDGNHSQPSASEWHGLVDISGNYVTVENLRIINSEGRGLRSVDNKHINCINIESDNTYGSGILYYNVDTGVIEGCDVTNAGRRWKESQGALMYPAALGVHSGSHNVIIRKNTVHETYGEGIGLYHKSYDCIVEENYCWANRAAQIYIDRSRDVHIRGNLVQGTTNSEFFRHSFWGFPGPGDGIGVNDERDTGDPWSQNNSIYNNLIAYTYFGIQLATQHDASTLKNTVVYNNTIVDCHICIKHDGPYENSYIRNNIVYCLSSDCRMLNSEPATTPGLTWSNNNWSTAVSGAASGTGDVIGVPNLVKSSGWRSMASEGDLDGSDFALQSNSPAIDGGIPLAADFREIPECDESVWPSQVVLMDQGNQGSGWEIGADIHVENSPGSGKPDPPSDLRIVTGQ